MTGCSTQTTVDQPSFRGDAAIAQQPQQLASPISESQLPTCDSNGKPALFIPNGSESDMPNIKGVAFTTAFRCVIKAASGDEAGNAKPQVSDRIGILVIVPGDQKDKAAKQLKSLGFQVEPPPLG